MEICKELEVFWTTVKTDVKEDTWADCHRVLERSAPLFTLLAENGKLTVDQRSELEEFLLQIRAFVQKNVETCGAKDSTSFIMRQEAAVDISFFAKKIIELIRYYNLRMYDVKNGSDIINHDALRSEDLKDQRQTFRFLLLSSINTARTEEELMALWKDVDDFVPIIRKFLALNRHMRLTVTETVELNQDMIMMKNILENKINSLPSNQKASSSNSSRDMTDEESQLPSVSSFISVGSSNSSGLMNESSETIEEREVVSASVFLLPSWKGGKNDKDVTPLPYSAIFSDLDPWSPNASRDILDLSAEEPSIDLKSLSLDDVEVVSASSLSSNVEGKTKDLLQKLITKESLTSEEKQLRETHLSALELQESEVIVTSIRMKQGSFGEIYLGNLSKFNKGPKTQRIAVKILRGMDQPGKMQTLRKQLENDCLLQHFFLESKNESPGSDGRKQRFLHCFGFISTVSTFELMIEYAPYGALSSFIFKSELLSKIPFSLMLLWLQQIIEAVAYLHSHQMNHGEITPDNIFVFNGLHLKLNYFGTLKQDIEDSLKGNLIPYLAPEVRNSGKKFQPSREDHYSSDIYSFAVTAVAIISQKVPQTATLQSQLLETLLKIPNSSYTAKKRLYDMLLQCLQECHQKKENNKDATLSRRPLADTLVLYLNNLIMMNADPTDTIQPSDSEKESNVETAPILSKEDIKAIEHIENILKIKQMDRLTFANVLPDKMKEDKRKKGGSKTSRFRTLPRFTFPASSSKEEKTPSLSSNDSKILSSVTVTAELQSISSDDRHEAIQILKNEVTKADNDSMESEEDPLTTIPAKPSLQVQSRQSSMPLNYTTFLNDEESKDRSNLASYFRNRMEFTIRNAWLVADILVKNGVPSISVLKRRILKENDFLLGLGIDSYLSDDVIEHFMQLEEEELDEEEKLVEQEEKQFAEEKSDKFLLGGSSSDEKHEDKEDFDDGCNRLTSFRYANNRSSGPLSLSRSSSLTRMSSPSPLSRSSYRLSSNLFCPLPSEVARIYYDASQCRNEAATEKLFAFARDNQDIISQGFVMRLYAKGQGLIQQDLEKAREYENFLFPQYLMRADEAGKAPHSDDLALVYIRYLLGVCYAEGLGVEKNLTEGFVWYRLSADHGNYAGAQAIVGTCYLYGQGTMKDPERAFHYYRLAADQGHAGAQSNLGYCYEHRIGTKRESPEDAVKWYKAASEQNDATANYNLGYCYERGYGGLPRDYSLAFQYYWKSAETSYTLAEHKLGSYYLNGYHGNHEINHTKAFEWFYKTAQKGYAPGQCDVGTCYESGRGVDQDYHQAVYWYDLAAKQGHGPALFYLGFCAINGIGMDKDLQKGLNYYQQSSEKKHPPALNNLGYCYYAGIGVEKDYSLAVHYYRQSADLDYPPGQYNLGYCYEYGYGIPSKINEMMKWYQKAAMNGHEKAIKRLQELKAM